MSSMVVRSSFTEKDMDRWFDENRITEIECLVPDLAGVARGKILPREKFTEDRGMRVPEDVLAMTVLFTTGYTRNAVIHQGRLDPGVELIGKPFTYAALVVKIQRVLGLAG